MRCDEVLQKEFSFYAVFKIGELKMGRNKTTLERADTTLLSSDFVRQRSANIDG